MSPQAPRPDADGVDDADREQLAAYYADFGRRWAHGTSPRYEEWAVALAADPATLALLMRLPPRKRQANLVFAAARWEGCPLAPYPRWRDWLHAHWNAVAATALARATQTNEVGRCATLLPVLARVPGPLALLEIGTAAGLCLFPDRYRYRYTTAAGEARLVGTADAADLELECRVDDAASVPDRIPLVSWRRGIDLAPVDAGDADAVDWLATLVWPGPDHDGRVARLRRAAAVTAAAAPQIVAADLVEALPEVAAAAPAEATLVVFHSAVLLYLDRAARDAFVRVLARIRRDRPLVWLSNESAGTLPEIDARLPAGLDTAQRFVQTVDGAPIALAGQHGATYETVPLRGSGAGLTPSGGTTRT